MLLTIIATGLVVSYNNYLIKQYRQSQSYKLEQVFKYMKDYENETGLIYDESIYQDVLNSNLRSGYEAKPTKFWFEENPPFTINFKFDEWEKVKNKPSKNIKHNATNTTKKSLNDFIVKLAKTESDFTPDNISKSGYIGLFQFGKIACDELEVDYYKLKSKTRNGNFSVYEQVSMYVDWLKIKRESITDKECKIAKSKWGFSESGIVAAAHLLGITKVKQIIAGNASPNSTDGNGVSFKEYASTFSGYDLDTFSINTTVNKITKKSQKQL